jgi:hypothetical protein
MVLLCCLSPVLPLAVILIVILIVVISPLTVAVATSIILLPLASCLMFDCCVFFFFSFVALPLLHPLAIFFIRGIVIVIFDIILLHCHHCHSSPSHLLLALTPQPVITAESKRLSY